MCPLSSRGDQQEPSDQHQALPLRLKMLQQHQQPSSRGGYFSPSVCLSVSNSLLLLGLVRGVSRAEWLSDDMADVPVQQVHICACRRINSETSNSSEAVLFFQYLFFLEIQWCLFLGFYAPKNVSYHSALLHFRTAVLYQAENIYTTASLLSTTAPSEVASCLLVSKNCGTSRKKKRKHGCCEGHSSTQISRCP